MNDNYGYTYPSINSPLIGKVIKYQDNTGFYLLQMPKRKKKDNDEFYYCNIDLHNYINKWVEIKVLKYTMYGRKTEINVLNKYELRNKGYKV